MSSNYPDEYGRIEVLEDAVRALQEQVAKLKPQDLSAYALKSEVKPVAELVAKHTGSIEELYLRSAKHQRNYEALAKRVDGIKVPDTSTFATKAEVRNVEGISVRNSEAIQSHSGKLKEQRSALEKVDRRLQEAEWLTPTIRLRAVVGEPKNGAVPVTLLFNARGKTERWRISQLHAAEAKELDPLVWRTLESSTQAPDEDGNDEKVFPGVPSGWSMFVVQQQKRRDGAWVSDDVASVVVRVAASGAVT